jgi:hypothetical protein
MTVAGFKNVKGASPKKLNKISTLFAFLSGNITLINTFYQLINSSLKRLPK